VLVIAALWSPCSDLRDHSKPSSVDHDELRTQDRNGGGHHEPPRPPGRTLRTLRTLAVTGQNHRQRHVLLARNIAICHRKSRDQHDRCAALVKRQSKSDWPIEVHQVNARHGGPTCLSLSVSDVRNCDTLQIPQEFRLTSGLPNNWLTPENRVLLEKLPVPQLVKKFPAFYETHKLTTIFTTVHHLTLSWARWIQCAPNRFILRSIFNITLSSRPRSSKRCFSLAFSFQNSVRNPHVPIRATIKFAFQR
jgi:hypothetical protein